jgi:hypothetical protein
MGGRGTRLSLPPSIEVVYGFAEQLLKIVGVQLAAPRLQGFHARGTLCFTALNLPAHLRLHLVWIFSGAGQNILKSVHLLGRITS